METDTQKKNKKYLLFMLVVYMFAFQNVIQKYIPIFQYFDEVLSLLVFPALVIKLKETKNFNIKKNHLILIILLLIIIAIGIYSNIKFKYQQIKFVLSDLLIFLKFFMAYFLSNILLDEDFINDNKSKIYKHIKLIVYFLFTCTVLNYIFNIWPGTDIRFGITSNRLFYEHPTYLSAVSIFLLALLELTRENKKEDVWPIICICIVLATTLRLKAIGAACLAVIMIVYLHKTQKKLTFIKLIILGIIGILLAHDQIIYYFIKIDQSARNQLLLKSFEIMKDFFPIGTGFATYGSYFSAISYSPVYYEYGLSKIQGLQPNAPTFVSDTFWPAIFGQFGVIGTVCYILCIIIIFKNIQGIFKKENVNIYISKLICLIYLIISSTSESAFMHPVAIPLAIIIGIKASTTKDKEDVNVKNKLSSNIKHSGGVFNE